jgi:hypothetical protein
MSRKMEERDQLYSLMVVGGRHGKITVGDSLSLYTHF